ncbi:MAG TPA: MFS transporter [Myxococcota bacterium]|jgi:MFS family permease
MPPLHPAYPWFIATVSCWFAAFGAQSVLFSWLVAGELHAGASEVGAAQMAGMLPSALFLLFGGAKADRSDCRALLTRVYASAAGLTAALFALVSLGWLSFPLLIAFALALGTVTAFGMPARDALLSEVAGGDMMRAVTGLTLAQWGSQAVGNLLGSSARWLETGPALCIPALVFAAGIAPLRRLPSRAAPATAARPSVRQTLSEIGEGLREVAHSPVLRPVMLLVASVGIFFMGPFMVVLPLLVRDHFGGDVAQLSLLGAAFPGGIILGSLVLLARGGLRRKGRAQLVSLYTGSASLAAIALGPPLAGTLAAIFVWGVTASVFMNAGRALFQQAAPSTHRGRVLSIYALGFMGSAPLGALVSGLLADAVGPLATCAICALAMTALATGASLLSGVSKLE